MRVSQHFGENPYFSDRVLRKEYRYVPPDGAKDEIPDENGVTDSMTDFDWDRDVVPQVRPLFTIPCAGVVDSCCRKQKSRGRATR